MSKGLLILPIGGGGVQPSGTLEIRSEGTFDVTNYAEVDVDIFDDTTTKTVNDNGVYNASDDNVLGYSQVTVNVPASAVVSGTKSITTNGNGQDVTNYASVDVDVQPNLTTLNVTPSTNAQVIFPSNVDGWDEVDVSAVTSAIDANITAGNIKKDVTILGVTGTLEQGIQPTGTFNITANGTYDITNYANVSVQVASGQDVDFICFTAKQINSQVAINIPNNTQYPVKFYVSTDNKETFSDWNGNAITLQNIGDKIYVYGDNPYLTYFTTVNGAAVYQTNYFSITGNVSMSGNIESLLNRKGVSYIPDYCFYETFKNCSGLSEANITIPDKPSGSSAYCKMFIGCTGLTVPPMFSQTILSEHCYQYMFQNCTSLTTAPALPATTLARNCYTQMFQGCSSLTTATALPATTLASSCYQSMFYGCTSLTTVPALPVTTLATNCYYQMFYGCTSLTTAPELPATTLASQCYYGMFYGCTSLTTAPLLSATTLEQSCYNQMFYGCTSLINAPTELPATTLATSCYREMFNGCTSLTTAPALPATTLANYCYYGMFSRCSGLILAPELPATTLANNCYRQMFDGCSQLSYVKVGATSWNSSYSQNWVNGVAATGMFVKPSSLVIGTGSGQIPSASANGIPAGWTVENCVPNSVKITNTSQNNGTFSVWSSDSNFPNYTNLEYSLDEGSTWTTLNTTYDTVTVPSGDSIYVRGTGNGTEFDNEEFTKLNFSEPHTISGNLANLINYSTASSLTVPQYAYYKLFNNDVTLTSADLIETDFDNGSTDTYKNLFSGCSNLSSVRITTNNWSTTKTEDWLTGVAANGTIYVNGDSTKLPTNSTSGVPTDWTAVDI